MELLNLIIAVASLVVSAIGSIYIPIHLHRTQGERTNRYTDPPRPSRHV